MWTYTNTIGTAATPGITGTAGAAQLVLSAPGVPPLNLSSGRYWLTVFPSMNGSGAGTSANPLWAWRVSSDPQIGNPPVIFLDEPPTGLDPQSRLEVWAAVREAAASGTTIVLTTQYLDEAEQLADRIAIVHEGRILAEGTLATIKALKPAPRIEYVERQPSLEEIFLALTAKDPS